MIYGDWNFTVIESSDGKSGDIISDICIEIDFTLFDEFEYGQRRKGFGQGSGHEIRVFCNGNFFFGIPIPIASREYHPAFIHHGDTGARNPVPLQVILDDCVENGDRLWKISLFEDRSIRMQRAAVEEKKDK
jgi:hypothetical protein